MKKIYLLFFLLSGTLLFGQTAGVNVFINEIHYDNAGTDVGEGVEIAGPAGTDLTGWSLVAYNGNGGASYITVDLIGSTIPNEGGSGFGTLFFAMTGLQNGAPDGIALTDGTNVQFLSYEGSFTAADGPASGLTSTDIGVVEPGSPIGESLQLIGTGSLASDFTWTGPVAESPGSINTNQTFSASLDPSVTILTPSDGTTFPPGTPNVNVTLSVQNFTVATPSAGDGFIKYTVDGGAPVDKFDTAPISLSLPSGPHTVVVELVDNAGASLSPQTSSTTSFTIATLTPIADIATLRAQPTGAGNFYQLNGEAVVSFAVANRNQIFMQDATAGILIDDAANTIATAYAPGDGMTGLKGTLSVFGGIVQFVPIEDPGTPSSNGKTVSPQVVTLADLNVNFDNYESQIVKIIGVTIDATNVTFTTASATNYPINVGADASILRTQHPESGLEGVAIPVTPIDLFGIVSEFGGASQLFPFYDFVNSPPPALLSTDDFSFDTASFKIYPNPVSTGIVNIVSAQNGSKTVAVYDILGKEMLRTQLNGTTLDVSQLNNGIYILKIEEDGKTTSKKLIVQQ
ncbi:MAG: T9SS type A sorting domain-containing protein [Bacteroidetes bacterium]|nr:T9SS type A sorting domain-containing protein [Bacteroidota bacterium]